MSFLGRSRVVCDSLSLFSLKLRRLKGDMITCPQYVKSVYAEAGEHMISEVKLLGKGQQKHQFILQKI